MRTKKASSQTIEAFVLWGFPLEQVGSTMVEQARLDALSAGPLVAMGHGVPFEGKVFGAVLGVVLARFETSLYEEQPGMVLALDMADAGDDSALPGVVVTAAELRAAKKPLTAVKEKALSDAAAQGLKVYDVAKPRAFLLVRGAAAAVVIAGEKKVSTTFEDGPKAVPATGDIRLCAWGRAGS
jgi:hypothetical protein